jgi:hypothetical protein
MSYLITMRTSPTSKLEDYGLREPSLRSSVTRRMSWRVSCVIYFWKPVIAQLLKYYYRYVSYLMSLIIASVRSESWQLCVQRAIHQIPSTEPCITSSVSAKETWNAPTNTRTRTDRPECPRISRRQKTFNPTSTHATSHPLTITSH